MSISLEPCSVDDDGFIVEYTIIKNKNPVGGLWHCPIMKRWQIISTAVDTHLTLINISEIWSRLIDRLGLEKERERNSV